jgi:hypothetical protein
VTVLRSRVTSLTAPPRSLGFNSLREAVEQLQLVRPDGLAQTTSFWSWRGFQKIGLFEQVHCREYD